MVDPDVVGNYDWTSMPKGSGIRKQAPKVIVHAYKINSSESLNRIVSYIKASSQSNPEEYYKALYSGNSEYEKTYRFPLLTDAIRSFSNTYGDTFKSEFVGQVDSFFNSMFSFGSEMGSIGTSIMSKMGGDVEAMPGSNVETPKLYQYDESDAPLEVSFILNNTINNSWKKNHDLVMELTRINRPERITYTFMRPPRIYKVKVPGVRFMEWASCASFSVQLLGTKRELEGILVPEGYLISMSFAPLTIEVNNFLKKV